MTTDIIVKTQCLDTMLAAALAITVNYACLLISPPKLTGVSAYLEYITDSDQQKVTRNSTENSINWI